MTQEEKEEAVRKLQERIKKEKAESIVANEKAEMESEMMRREQGRKIWGLSGLIFVGKASIEAKEEWDKQQAEKAAREARKDRERNLRVEAEAKERIRVAAYNRELEYNARMGIKTETAPVVVAPKKEFQECTIQIRLPPPNNRLQNNFKPTDTLQDVVDFISTSAPSINFKYQLVVPGIGPKKTFSGDSLSTTLAEADLVPRGAVVVEKIWNKNYHQYSDSKEVLQWVQSKKAGEIFLPFVGRVLVFKKKVVPESYCAATSHEWLSHTVFIVYFLPGSILSWDKQHLNDCVPRNIFLGDRSAKTSYRNDSQF